MKKFMVSYYGTNPFTGKHEVSIYKNTFGGNYIIYLDNEFWTNINSLYEFEDELKFIEESINTKFGFLGF